MTNRLEVCTEPMSNPGRLQQLAGFQIMILRSALTRYPNAKRVVYSTCSLNTEENEDVVRQVLETNNLYKLVPAGDFLQNNWTNFGSSSFGKIGQYCLYARPEDDLTNGFFLAVFERLAEGEENEFYNNRASRYITNMQRNKTRRENRNLQSANSTSFLKEMDPNQDSVEPKDKFDNWQYDYEQADEWRESEESGKGPGPKLGRVDIQLKLINGQFDKRKAEKDRLQTDEFCANKEERGNFQPKIVGVKVEDVEFVSGKKRQKVGDAETRVEEFPGDESNKSKRKKNKGSEDVERQKAKRHRVEDSNQEVYEEIGSKTNKSFDAVVRGTDEEIDNKQKKKVKRKKDEEDNELEVGSEENKKSKWHKSENNEEGGKVEHRKGKSHDLDVPIVDEELGGEKKKKSKRTKKEELSETREEGENLKGKKDVDIIIVDEELGSEKKKKSKRTKKEEFSETGVESEDFKGKKDVEILIVGEEVGNERKKKSKRAKKEESSVPTEDSKDFKGVKDVEILIVNEELGSEKRKKSKRTKRELSEVGEDSEVFKGKNKAEILIADGDLGGGKKKKSKRAKREESSEVREDSEDFKGKKDIILVDQELEGAEKKKSKRTKREELSETMEEEILVVEEVASEKKKKSRRTQKEELSDAMTTPEGETKKQKKAKN